LAPEEANGLTAVSDSTTNANTGFVTYATQGDGITIFPKLGVPAIFTNGASFAKPQVLDKVTSRCQ